MKSCHPFLLPCLPTGLHLRAGDEEQKPGHLTILCIVTIDTKKSRVIYHLKELNAVTCHLGNDMLDNDKKGKDGTS